MKVKFNGIERKISIMKTHGHEPRLLKLEGGRADYWAVQNRETHQYYVVFSDKGKVVGGIVEDRDGAFAQAA